MLALTTVPDDLFYRLFAYLTEIMMREINNDDETCV
jgi:hypothetical protein